MVDHLGNRAISATDGYSVCVDSPPENFGDLFVAAGDGYITSEFALHAVAHLPQPSIRVMADCDTTTETMTPTTYRLYQSRFHRLGWT